MVFDPTASCTEEGVFHLPVCRQGAPETLKLHAAIQGVCSWMADHHIQKDEWDAPYVYRDYLVDWISGNDVAALGRVARAVHARGLDLPALFQPFLPTSENDEVVSGDVTYAAANADALADGLGPLLAAMQAVDDIPLEIPWWVLAGIGGAAAVVGFVTTALYHQRVHRAA